MSKRTYHRNKCSECVRAFITDRFGNQIMLIGKHAFEWSIVKEVDGRIVITSYPNRTMAQKEFNQYKRKR